MDALRKQQLIRQRAVAKASLTRKLTFIETGDRKLNEMQVRFEEHSNIYKFETAQSELELFDKVDHPVDRQQFEDNFFAVKAKFNELLHSVPTPPLSRHSSSHSSSSRHTHVSHYSSSHIKLPVVSLSIFEGETTSWLHYRENFEALIVTNNALSNIQKFHYLTASLKGEAKGVISNLQITNENFSVAWN